MKILFSEIESEAYGIIPVYFIKEKGLLLSSPFPMTIKEVIDFISLNFKENEINDAIGIINDLVNGGGIKLNFSTINFERDLWIVEYYCPKISIWYKILRHIKLIKYKLNMLY